ncbi:MAG: 16S rRNA (cytosine(1402)-N(4))-methyltransferase RsmH [Simkaniaceae bacterium]|nr:16S rRNA (cytosine(1402)-N(4))-methyltransferase RsmH [Simkaniaceae bacterium]MCF7852448.1 16S rRNA (cytosine(1402)-N(4))-methyltransferase RsmH [Simkaniaceae bacterium]
MNQNYHISVMREEVIQGFKASHLRVFCEGTLGAGGHAKEILADHPEIAAYFGIDRDFSAIEIAKENLKPYQDKVHYIQANFSDLDRIFEEYHIDQVDGFLFDLGVSSMQFDQGERGFSFRTDAPLDMRMDPTQSLTAAEVIAFKNEKELGAIFRDYGEVPFWKRAAKMIVETRKKQPITTTVQLASLIEKMLGGRGKIHPATQIFQALRIYVNEELSHVEEGLKKALHYLAPEGVIGVITFHSLEDRIVKNIFREAASPIRSESGKKVGDSPFELCHKKPLIPSHDEIKKNTRSRSAKLRWIRRR